MKSVLYRTWAILLVAAFVVPACCGAEPDRDRFSVSRGNLRRGSGLFTLQAIDVPDLAEPTPTVATMAPALDYVASVGANSVCFNLYGLSDDGTALSAEGVRALRLVVGQATWRRMGIVCRIFALDAPKDAAYRLAAVRAAAKALKKDVRVVYWIDGPDCAKLVAAFNETAPNLVVAAAEGGAVRVVTEEPADAGGQPILMDGVMPKKPKGRTHYVLPPDRASYEAMDRAMATPVEFEPWTPDNSVLTPQEREEGWVALFDGKSLAGWWIAGGNQKGFVARDGAIQWNRPGGSMILTRNRYSDFILRFEWKLETQGSNSGVFLRAPRANRASKIGMEFQLMGDYGKEPEKHITGAIYDVLAPLKNGGKPVGEWNELEITLDGPKMKAVLNGTVVQDLDLDSNEELKYRLRQGFIGFQDHGHPVSFRNIRLKEL